MGMVAEQRQQKTRVETRGVICTNCDRPIEIPATAMSVSCRHCHRRVIIEDIKIKTYHAVTRIATAGRVEVMKRGQLVAQVRVNELAVEGTVKGDITVLGKVLVGRKATILGDVSCRSLAVQLGARLSGRFRVDPRFAPEPPAEAEEESEIL